VTATESKLSFATVGTRTMPRATMIPISMAEATPNPQAYVAVVLQVHGDQASVIRASGRR
jgi:hypothetical protein